MVENLLVLLVGILFSASLNAQDDFDNLEFSINEYLEDQNDFESSKKVLQSSKKIKITPYLLTSTDDLDLVGLDISAVYERPFFESWYFESSLELNLANNISKSDKRSVDNIRLKPHKFNIQYSNNEYQFKVGWQNLTVGEVEGAQVLDVLSPTSSALNSNIAGEKIPQLMLVGHYYGKNKLTGFISPNPSNSFVYDENNAAQDFNPDTHTEYGVSLASRFGKVETQFVAAKLMPNIPIAYDGTTINSPYNLLGLSATYPINKWLLKTEFSSKKETRSETPEDRIEVALGAEIDTNYFGMLSTFIVVADWEDENHPNTDRWVGAWSDQFLNENLTLNLALSQFSGYKETGIAFDINYQYNDLTRIGLSVIKTPPQFEQTEDLWQAKFGVEWVY